MRVMAQGRAWRISALAFLVLWGASDLQAQQSGANRSPPASTAQLSSLQRARALLAANDLDAARAVLEATISRAPGSAEAHHLLGLVYERQNKLAEALSSYDSALRLDATRAEAHDRRGFVLGRLGRTADALSAFERAVQLAPDLFDAQYHLGATRWWTKDIDGALIALRAAVRLRPDHAEA